MKRGAETSRDPVCGMDVEIAGSSHSTTHRGSLFHFCSSQCLENFRNNPALYFGLARHLDNQPMPKQRRLRLAAGDDADSERACRRIRAMMGISAVTAGKDLLIVEYDLKQATLSQIEAVATEEGLRFTRGFHGFRRWLWRFSESNELNNAAHPRSGDCCNHPPARER